MPVEQIVIIGVFIVISLLDAIAKSAKKRKAEEELERYAEADAGGTLFEVEDAPWEAEAEPEWREGRAEREVPARGSEDMVPKDLWEEIAALAGGRLEREEPEPEPIEIEPVSLESPAPDIEAESRALQRSRTRPPVAERGQFTTTPIQVEHYVHRAHALYGTDPSERPPSEQDGMDPLAEFLSEDAAAIRSQLRSKNVHSLRQALILSEVLGTPVGMRD